MSGSKRDEEVEGGFERQRGGGEAKELGDGRMDPGGVVGSAKVKTRKQEAVSFDASNRRRERSLTHS